MAVEGSRSLGMNPDAATGNGGQVQYPVSAPGRRGVHALHPMAVPADQLVWSPQPHDPRVIDRQASHILRGEGEKLGQSVEATCFGSETKPGFAPAGEAADADP